MGSRSKAPGLGLGVLKLKAFYICTYNFRVFHTHFMQCYTPRASRVTLTHNLHFRHEIVEHVRVV